MSSLAGDSTTAIVVSIALMAAFLIWTASRFVRSLARFYALRSETRRMLHLLDHLDLATTTDVQITHLQSELQAIAGDLDTLRAGLRGAACGFLRRRRYDLANACKALALLAHMLRRSDATRMALYRSELCRALKLPLPAAAKRPRRYPHFALRY